jgi:hypothetical protein
MTRFEAPARMGKVRRFKKFFDGAASWSRVERVIARVEVGARSHPAIGEAADGAHMPRLPSRRTTPAPDGACLIDGDGDQIATSGRRKKSWATRLGERSLHRSAGAAVILRYP